MKKILALVLCLCALLTLVACNDDGDNTPDIPDVVEADYKLGMGIVVNMDSSAKGNAQVDATVATVVTDANGKIVLCRIDVAQNKMNVADGAVDTAQTFQTKMERGDDYGMAAALNYGMDWNGDGQVKEWYDQAKAFESFVVGKTAAEVEALTTKQAAAEGAGAGYQISTDAALLAAGCTIQINEFRDAVVKACKDEQGMSFKAVAGSFTLGVAAKTTAAESTAATAEEDGTVKMYSDFAASVVANGKIVATLNDAIQPNVTINTAGEIVNKDYKNTKRELKEDYHMAAYGQSMDWNGDGKVLEWYLQSAEFSKFVVGKTAAEVGALTTKQAAAEGAGAGYQISADDALLTAGCTIQITSIKTVVAQSVTNAR